MSTVQGSPWVAVLFILLLNMTSMTKNGIRCHWKYVFKNMLAANVLHSKDNGIAWKHSQFKFVIINIQNSDENVSSFGSLKAFFSCKLSNKQIVRYLPDVFH